MSNEIKVKGNLGKDPIVLRFTQAGDPVASFSLADTPRRFNKETQEWEDAGDTLWYDVSLWGEEGEQLAERASTYRGQITVTGRLGLRSYEAQDGTTRTVPTIRADSVALHVDKSTQGSQPEPRQQQQGGGYRQRAQNARVYQATSGDHHRVPQTAYQPGPGGPRQQADEDPWGKPAAERATAGWGGAPSYDEPPF